MGACKYLQYERPCFQGYMYKILITWYGVSYFLSIRDLICICKSASSPECIGFFTKPGTCVKCHNSDYLCGARSIFFPKSDYKSQMRYKLVLSNDDQTPIMALLKFTKSISPHLSIPNYRVVFCTISTLF